MGDDFDPTAQGINLNQMRQSCGQSTLSVSNAAPLSAARLDERRVGVGGVQGMVETADNWRVDERQRHAIGRRERDR